MRCRSASMAAAQAGSAGAKWYQSVAAERPWELASWQRSITPAARAPRAAGKSVAVGTVLAVSSRRGTTARER
jgi:hypothetical protein